MTSYLYIHRFPNKELIGKVKLTKKQEKFFEEHDPAWIQVWLSEKLKEAIIKRKLL